MKREFETELEEMKELQKEIQQLCKELRKSNVPSIVDQINFAMFALYIIVIPTPLLLRTIFKLFLFKEDVFIAV
jgi:hypothetical protein